MTAGSRHKHPYNPLSVGVGFFEDLTSITTVQNQSATTTDTFELSLTAVGFSALPTGATVRSAYSVQYSDVSATGVAPFVVNCYVDASNTAFGTAIALGTVTVPPGPTPYTYWTEEGLYSVTQDLAITLGPGVAAQVTIYTETLVQQTGWVWVNPELPEPPSVVLAGFGAVFLVGHVLWRRKTSA